MTCFSCKRFLRRVLFAVAVFTPALLAQKPIGEVHSTDATVRGSVVFAASGATIMSGAQVSSGQSAATLKLVRGGEVRICPRSNITISSSDNGRDNLFALNSGAIEAHYDLGTSADFVITPDFRVQLPGPGAFHFAFSSGEHGDMCVHSLPGSTSSVVVTESFGENTRQVKPGEDVTFHSGRVDSVTSEGQNCGCPVPASPVVHAAIPPASPTPPIVLPKNLRFPEQESKRAAEEIAAGKQPPAVPPAAPSNPPKPGEVAMQVDAPMIFNAPDRAEDLPPTAATVARNNLAAVRLPELQPRPLPPEKSKPAGRKWYKRFGSAFARIFK